MPALPLFTRIPYCKPVGIAMFAMVLSGCAQQKTAGYYDTPHDNTMTDAQAYAQGRTGTRAPSQIRLGFGDEEGKKPKSAAEPATEGNAVKARPLAEAKTFLGTLPCLVNTPACSATRITLTMAPAGQWRARTVMLDNPGAENDIIQQGCWAVIGTKPLRVVLQLKNEATKANLSFINDNVLRVNMINDTKPTLDYHLTRQQDIDPIDELASEPAPQCD
ncbi:hypothetical protein EKL30_14485 [Candidimonas sp. SYP-B2681]|uniref:hypothetical protein n=1 Tax=Candidimonas sp. SYP-B2681 TaxID=2497686 RepID=UPI000F88695D|nr:hypothetical protein [Candidimonas sp. SYP-B2681]RTZ41756.1 hypothetical protein EKL30_14485 [Candidimonas sp. SYP-B2681]